ncbi:MAG: hypothetical protein ACOYT4_04080 [Nanoarchaeota archaeon]
MEKALILIGKIEENESYQLLIGLKYTSIIYYNSVERERFYEELSDIFAKKLLQEHSQLELGLINGLMINSETGNKEKIEKLEDIFANQLSQFMHRKIKQATETLSTCIQN